MNEKQTPNKAKTSVTPSAAFKIAAAAIFASLVAAATLLFVIPIPATSGYFNLGETLIYVAALLFGPLVGLSRGSRLINSRRSCSSAVCTGNLYDKSNRRLPCRFLNQETKSKNQKSHRMCHNSYSDRWVRNGCWILPLRNPCFRLPCYFGSSGNFIQYYSNANWPHNCSTHHACGFTHFPTA